MVRFTRLVPLVFVLTACLSDVSEQRIIEVVHKNILIVTDHTNRLSRPKPLHDTTVLKSIINYYWSEANLYQRRKLGHKDRMVYRRISNSNWVVGNGLSRIDLGDFKDKNYHRNRYIKNMRDSNERILSDDIRALTKSIIDQYEVSGKAAGSIYQTLNSLTVNELKNPKDSIIDLVSGIKQVNKNTILLFTDGYIEYGGYRKDYIKGKFLSRRLVANVREEVVTSNISILEAASKLGVRLSPLDNPLLKGAWVHVLETDDVSLDANGNPSGLPTDREIYTILWTDWLLNSGAAKVMFHEPFRSKSEAIQFARKHLSDVYNQ